MSTRATNEMMWFAGEWQKLFGSAKFSGIVGDKAHQARGGYHIGRAYQPSSNYSVIRTDDKPGNGPNDTASAVDMNLALADMKTAHIRLRNAWADRDPRMNYINAWNGWDGNDGAGRYDVVKHTVDGATSDHKWHMHLEFRRKYCTSMTAMRAVLSLLSGQSLADYQKASPVMVPVGSVSPIKPTAKPSKVETKAPAFPLAKDKYFAKSSKFNAHVKIAQRRLEQRGWNLGDAGADGYFGPTTDKVIRQFQHEKHLTVDGKLGPNTWRAIWEAPIT